MTEPHYEVIPPGFDLGIEGYPKGGITTIAGPPGSGKTTLALRAIAECQAQGGRAAFVDLVGDFRVEAATAQGVDVSKLLVAQPPTIDSLFDLLQDQPLDLLVLEGLTLFIKPLPLIHVLNSLAKCARRKNIAILVTIGHRTFESKIQLPLALQYSSIIILHLHPGAPVATIQKNLVWALNKRLQLGSEP